MPKSAEYMLKMEIIAMDERLCRTLDRTMRLCDQAEAHEATEEAERIRQFNSILVSTKRSLDRLAGV